VRTGFWTTLALVAIFVPAIEEVLFRGVILQALSRYLSFRWLQYFRRHYLRVCTRRPKLAYVFLLGLLAGWLVRRTADCSRQCSCTESTTQWFLPISTATVSLNAGG